MRAGEEIAFARDTHRRQRRFKQAARKLGLPAHGGLLSRQLVANLQGSGHVSVRGLGVSRHMLLFASVLYVLAHACKRWVGGLHLSSSSSSARTELLSATAASTGYVGIAAAQLREKANTAGRPKLLPLCNS